MRDGRWGMRKGGYSAVRGPDCLGRIYRPKTSIYLTREAEKAVDNVFFFSDVVPPLAPIDGLSKLRSSPPIRIPKAPILDIRGPNQTVSGMACFETWESIMEWPIKQVSSLFGLPLQPGLRLHDSQGTASI